VYSFSVQPGSYTVYVDASNTPGGYLIGSVLTKLDVALGAGPVTYPTIALYKRISVQQPASGAVVRSPVTFAWDTLSTTNVYELRVYEDDSQKSRSRRFRTHERADVHAEHARRGPPLQVG